MSSPHYPDWVHQLSERRLVDLFGELTLARGQEYVRQGRVGHIAMGSGTGWQPDSGAGARRRATAPTRRWPATTPDTSAHQHVLFVPGGPELQARRGAAVAHADGEPARADARMAARPDRARPPRHAEVRSGPAAGHPGDACGRCRGGPAASAGLGTSPAAGCVRGSRGTACGHPWGGEFLEEHRAVAGRAGPHSRSAFFQLLLLRRARTCSTSARSRTSAWYWLARGGRAAGIPLVPASGQLPVRLAAEPAQLTSRLSRTDAGLAAPHVGGGRWAGVHAPAR